MRPPSPASTNQCDVAGDQVTTIRALARRWKIELPDGDRQRDGRPRGLQGDHRLATPPCRGCSANSSGARSLARRLEGDHRRRSGPRGMPGRSEEDDRILDQMGPGEWIRVVGMKNWKTCFPVSASPPIVSAEEVQVFTIASHGPPEMMAAGGSRMRKVSKYWPPGVPRQYTVEAYIAAFESIGDSKCDDSGLESGFEKVAIYARGGEPTHASRQLDDGIWAGGERRTASPKSYHLEASSIGDEYRGRPFRYQTSPVKP